MNQASWAAHDETAVVHSSKSFAAAVRLDKIRTYNGDSTGQAQCKSSPPNHSVRKQERGMRWIKLAMISLLMLLAGSQLRFLSSASRREPLSFPRPNLRPGTATSDSWKLYDPAPGHLWNRLYRALYQRVTHDGKDYGYDELDPLLWDQTRYLLTNPAYDQANTLLDEFISTHAEKTIKDPMKRAILQRDLWAVFDWTTQVPIESREKTNLQVKLAQVMKRLALSPEEIAKLPNTYDQAARTRTFAAAYDLGRPEQPFLPPDLFSANGPWVQLSSRGGDTIARAHTAAFSGRSVFLIFMRLPEGRDATIKYLTKLADFRNPWIPDPQEPTRLAPNPDLPQFPAGTALALIRMMVLVDNQGNLQPTSLIEEIQIRVHRAVPNTIENSRNPARAAMDVGEFKLSRTKLFAGESGGLRALGKEDTEFPIFQSHGDDLFDANLIGIQFERLLRVPLQFCAACHSRSGVHSMLSRAGRVLVPSWDPTYETNGTRAWKARQYNWGLLRGLWQTQPALN
jgi:hypothetical protein